MTRKEYLLDLIDGIYGAGNGRVNFDEYGITRKSGLRDKTNQTVFKGRKSMGSYCEQYRKLFIMTFIDDNVNFDLPYGNGQFTREIAYENARNYLIKHGVEFILIGDIVIDDYDSLIIEAINNCILPAIFHSYIDINNSEETNDNENKDIGDEIIDNEYAIAIQQINNRIFSAFMLLKHQIKNKDVLVIKDSSYNEYDYNYAIPMKTHSVCDPEKVYFPNIEAYAERCLVGQEDNKEKKSPQSFEEMTKGYSKYPFNRDDIFKEPDTISIPEQELRKLQSDKSRRFFISSVMFYSDALSNQNFYYVTNINEYLLKSKHPEIKTHDDLDKFLREEAKKDVEKYYKTGNFQYYNCLMDYIEDVIKRIYNIDLNIFINVESDNLEIYRSNIECFNIDADYIIKFLHDSLNSQLQIYLMIERIIKEFYKSLRTYGRVLVRKLYSILNEDDVKKHMNQIKKYIESEYLENAIKMQHDSVNKYPWMYKLPTNTNSKLNGVKTPILYDLLKKSLLDYYSFLAEGKQEIIIDN